MRLELGLGLVVGVGVGLGLGVGLELAHDASVEVARAVRLDDIWLELLRGVWRAAYGCVVRHVAVWRGGVWHVACGMLCGVWCGGVWCVVRRRVGCKRCGMWLWGAPPGMPPRGLQEAGAARCEKMGVAGLGRRDGRGGGRGGGRGACCANERAVSNMAFSSSDSDDESASGSCQSKVCVVDTARCGGGRERGGVLEECGGWWRRVEGGGGWRVEARLSRQRRAGGRESWHAGDVRQVAGQSGRVATT